MPVTNTNDDATDNSYKPTIKNILKNILNGTSSTLVTDIQSIITGVGSTNESNTVPNAIYYGFKYWADYATYTIQNSISYSVAAADNGYIDTAKVSINLAKALYVQFYEFVGKCIIWSQNNTNIISSTTLNKMKNVYKILNDGAESPSSTSGGNTGTYPFKSKFMEYVNTVNKLSDKSTMVINPQDAELTNVKKVSSFLISVHNYAVGNSNISGSIINLSETIFGTNGKIANMMTKINNNVGFSSMYNLTKITNTYLDLQSDILKFSNYQSKTEEYVNSRLKPELEKTINSSNSLILNLYKNSIMYASSAKRYLELMLSYYDEFIDSVGYNPVEYSAMNSTPLYVTGMSLWDSADYVVINTYMTIAKSLLDSAIERYGLCIDLLNVSCEIRTEKRFTSIVKSINTVNDKLTSTNKRLNTIDTTSKSNKADINTLSNTLSSLIIAHNNGIQMNVTDTMSDNLDPDPFRSINITEYISIIRNNIYGKDIRAAIANALEILQNNDNKPYMSGKSCTYAEWVTAGKPSDIYTIYFIYDLNAIIYKGVKYEFNAGDSIYSAVSSPVDNMSGPSNFALHQGSSISIIDSGDIYLPDDSSTSQAEPI